MARTSSSPSGRSSSSYSSYSYGRSSSKTTPKPSPHTSQSQSSNKTELDNKGNKSSGGGFMSSVMDGFSFGFGSNIAHRVVGGIFRSSSTYPHTKEAETHYHHYHSQESTDISKPEYITKPECKSLQEEYLKCIQSSTTDFQSTCDFSLNIFKDCELEANGKY